VVVTTDISGPEVAGEHVSSDSQSPLGANCPAGKVALGGGARIRTVPSSSTDEGKVAFLASRPRAEGWYAEVRINQDFTQLPNIELQLDTYVICTT
jgi:hypothetical protein